MGEGMGGWGGVRGWGGQLSHHHTSWRALACSYIIALYNHRQPPPHHLAHQADINKQFSQNQCRHTRRTSPSPESTTKKEIMNEPGGPPDASGKRATSVETFQGRKKQKRTKERKKVSEKQANTSGTEWHVSLCHSVDLDSPTVLNSVND